MPENLEQILQIYKPEFRYLKTCTINFPRAHGTFKLNPTYYTTHPEQHMTAIEAQLCLNQLCYAAFAQWLPEGRFRASPPSENLQRVTDQLLIVQTKMNFQQPINPEKTLNASIELSRTRETQYAHLAFVNYDFEKGKSNGSLILALKK